MGIHGEHRRLVMRADNSGRWFDDFRVGQRFETEGYTFTESSIIDFALQYDPQYFHLDRERAAESIYGGLVASGFHTLAVVFRLIVQARVFGPGNMGGRGMDEVRWQRAIRPGDTLRVTCEVLELLPSSHPQRGNMRMSFHASNQRDETALIGVLMPIIQRRPVAE